MRREANDSLNAWEEVSEIDRDLIEVNANALYSSANTVSIKFINRADAKWVLLPHRIGTIHPTGIYSPTNFFLRGAKGESG